ncbi:MAG TPA: exostosin family protein [Chryseosolibacter sp.]|nr:exostosin family protein [Chryseosolibacter sp.]
MKIFFVDKNWSELADDDSRMLSQVKRRLTTHDGAVEVSAPELADVVLLQEKFSYKDFRYIDNLLKDPVISQFSEKVFTINCDDCATGLLRGLYTSLPVSRFSPGIHAAIPYMEYPNELVFSSSDRHCLPSFLAGWRGNTRSNALRLRMIEALKSNRRFCLETTDSWLNHHTEEKKTYVDVMLNAKFSLCPAGWAPVSFRIYESMALGRCPVILADEFVPPSGPDWRSFALFFPENKIGRLADFLYQREHLYEQLGNAARQAWDRSFAPGFVEDYISEILLCLIRNAPKTTKRMEVARWKSSKLYWSNRWTLPQRVVNKAVKFSKSLVAN